MEQELSRRHFIATGLGLVVAGCATTDHSVTSRPRPLWPVAQNRPLAGGNVVAVPQRVASANFMGPVMAISRSQWAKARPIQKRMQAMGRIKRITVHHEGWTPVWFSDQASTARRLEAIRCSHLKRLRAGDIGYHLVIDRAGKNWQGRDLAYQGAHVRDHNVHNIGIMVLGNFDLQRPSDVQMSALRATVAKLMYQYEIPTKQVFTHQEFNVTSCPGKALQNLVVAMRGSGGLDSVKTI